MKSIVTPQSLLIEKTALDFAAIYWEAGRSSGLDSKHKTAKAFAKANLEKFIPLAISTLLDMMGNPSTSSETKDMIYSAIMERTNDPELSNSGIKAFENNIPFLPELPKLYDKSTIENAFRDTQKMLSMLDKKKAN